MSDAVNEGSKKMRPEFRNIHVTELSNYRLPPAGIVSILHRISGFLMFLLLPVMLYLLDKSLTSEDTFSFMQDIVATVWAKLFILALSWAYLQHFCAGIRHLIMDSHIGLDKDSARQSALTVLAVSFVLTVLVALKLFGVF
jgi:succinate dehydrogenase / fumarate reductase cytochrome b subunit